MPGSLEELGVRRVTLYRVLLRLLRLSSPLPHSRYDVAIVGGGIVGLATAFAFAPEVPSPARDRAGEGAGGLRSIRRSTTAGSSTPKSTTARDPTRPGSA